MVQRFGLIRCVSVSALLGYFCLLVARPGAVAAEEGKAGSELSSLVARVDPCVVTIRMQHSQGSGFVVDAHGTIATSAVSTLPPFSERLVKNLSYVPAVMSTATIDAVFTSHCSALDSTVSPAGNVHSAIREDYKQSAEFFLDRCGR